MAGPLIGARVLGENPDAWYLHNIGLTAELDGNFPLAHKSFHEALAVLGNEPDTIDSLVQSARIIRDDGFTDVRAAIASYDPKVLDKAEATIISAVGRTQAIIDESDMSDSVGAEVQAEHGMSVSLLGRIVTVRQVMTGTNTYPGSPEAEDAIRKQKPYHDAHKALLRGNNGYGLVGNAIIAARQERLNERKPEMRMWLNRAASGLVWTTFRDPRNLVPAARTLAGRSPHLRSYNAAIHSVITMP